MLFAPLTAAGLPAVKTLADCTDFSKTVTPFLYQLDELPGQLLASVTSFESLKSLYISTNPVISSFAFSLFASVVFLVVSEVNRNYSQVDRCWSLLPTFYNAHYTLWAHLNGLPTQRLDALLVASCIWSTRLTFNYWRKGGYSVGSEDYRWEIVKSKVPALAFFLFNVSFISTIQSVLLWLIAAPTYILLLASCVDSETFSVHDYFFVAGLIGLVIVEVFADGQQWNYQTAKASYKKTAKVPAGYKQEALDRGFIATGLWKYSRHPNFAAEQSIWVLLYQWACFETYSHFNWTFAGAMSYLFLFQGSTWLTELISSGKYPEYKIYQERVGKFLPNLMGKSWNDHVNKPVKADSKKRK